MRKKAPTYTVEQAIADLGGAKPDAAELQRLVENYPTYSQPHRQGLLQGMFAGASNEEQVSGKLQSKGLPDNAAKQSKGGHARWVVFKMRRTVIRLLYLRLRLDKQLTRRKANQQLVKKFGFSTAKDGGRSCIRKATQCPDLDG